MPKKRAATLLLVFMMSLSVGVAAAEPPEREPTTARPPTAKAQPSEEPAPQENEEEVFANSGVVVEKVGKGSALEKADLQPGDVLYRWRRLPNPPANPTEASGKFASPFDWWDVKSEQAPRSAVELLGQREHRWKNWTILPGDWAGEARPNWPEEVTKLYLLGLHRIENGEIEVGVEVWQELVKRRVGGKFDLCRHWLTLRISETWAQAKHWQKIVPLLREIETAPSLNRVKAYAFQRLGKVALQSGDLERATDYLQKSRPVQMADSLSLATTLNNLGLVANYNGDLAQATDLLEKAIEIEEAQAPGSLMLAASMTNLAVAQRQSGDLPNAERNLKKTLQIEEIRTPKSLSVAATLNNLGSVEFYRGDLAYAAEYFKQAFAIQEKLSRLQDVATSLNNLGTVEARKGELQLAAEYFRRSLAILEVEAPASTELAHTLHNLGANARDLGDLPLATSYYERALAVKEHQAPDSLDLSITLSNLGALAFDSGDLSRASDFSRRAMEIEEKKAPNSLMVTYNLNTLGNVAFRRGNFELAKGYYQRALDIAERIAPDTSSNELLDLGRVARAMGDLNTAFNLFEHSLKVTESQLAHLGSSHETEAHFLSREQYPVYREALSLQLELNHPEVAFHLLERSRAQSYLAMFAERELVFSDLPPELDAERRQIAVQYDHTLQLVQNLIPVKDGQRITRIRGSLLMLRQRQQVLQHEIRERVPKLAAIQYPRPLDVLAVQQVLDSGTLLLSYSVGAEKTAIFVVSHSGGLQVKILPLGEQALRARVKLLLSLAREANGGSSLGEHRRTQLQAASREIFTALLGPVADRIAASERLLILPDGPLHVLPFGVLVHDAKD
ncbi:MAG TPA: tetratricopeptide repeat protein, partial [Thermoanaerobaculia bacterium]|nr:tetratricopeptide repeat protein [Thermoanaerobaculia bacterium]